MKIHNVLDYIIIPCFCEEKIFKKGEKPVDKKKAAYYT